MTMLKAFACNHRPYRQMLNSQPKTETQLCSANKFVLIFTVNSRLSALEWGGTRTTDNRFGGVFKHSMVQTLDIANTGWCNHLTRACSLSVDQSICPFRHFVCMCGCARDLSGCLTIMFLVLRQSNVCVKIFYFLPV